MSQATRDKPAQVTVCDICDQEIPECTESLDRGSLTHGYIAHKVTPRTKWAWLIWPPQDRPGSNKTWQEKQAERKASRTYDFHAECIVKLVQEAAERNKK